MAGGSTGGGAGEDLARVLSNSGKSVGNSTGMDTLWYDPGMSEMSEDGDGMEAAAAADGMGEEGMSGLRTIPFAVPLKLESLRFPAIEEAWGQLSAGPFAGSIIAGLIEETDEAPPAVGFRLPPGCLRNWQETLEQMKRVVRLPHEVSLWLAPGMETILDNTLHGRQLRYFINAALAGADATPEERMAGVSLLLVNTLHPQPFGRAVARLLKDDHVLTPEERTLAERARRWTLYQNGLLPVALCGDSGLVASVVYRHLTGHDCGQLDLAAVARAALEDTGREDGPRFPDTELASGYPVLLPLVLERFQQTEACRALRGLPGGTSWARFVDEIAEMDALLHPDEQESSESERFFCVTASLLAVFCAVEGVGGTPPALESSIIGIFEFESETLDQLASMLGWRRGPGGNIAEVTQRFLSGGTGLFLKHCVDILEESVRLLHFLGNGQIDPRGVQALERALLPTPVTPPELARIVNHHLEQIEQSAETETGSEDDEEGD